MKVIGALRKDDHICKLSGFKSALTVLKYSLLARSQTPCSDSSGFTPWTLTSSAVPSTMRRMSHCSLLGFGYHGDSYELRTEKNDLYCCPLNNAKDVVVWRTRIRLSTRFIWVEDIKEQCLLTSRAIPLIMRRIVWSGFLTSGYQRDSWVENIKEQCLLTSRVVSSTMGTILSCLLRFGYQWDSYELRS